MVNSSFNHQAAFDALSSISFVSKRASDLELDLRKTQKNVSALASHLREAQTIIEILEEALFALLPPVPEATPPLPPRPDAIMDPPESPELHYAIQPIYYPSSEDEEQGTCTDNRGAQPSPLAIGTNPGGAAPPPALQPFRFERPQSTQRLPNAYIPPTPYTPIGVGAPPPRRVGETSLPRRLSLPLQPATPPEETLPVPVRFNVADEYCPCAAWEFIEIGFEVGGTYCPCAACDMGELSEQGPEKVEHSGKPRGNNRHCYACEDAEEVHVYEYHSYILGLEEEHPVGIGGESAEPAQAKPNLSGGMKRRRRRRRKTQFVRSWREGRMILVYFIFLFLFFILFFI